MDAESLETTDGLARKAPRSKDSQAHLPTLAPEDEAREGDQPGSAQTALTQSSMTTFNSCEELYRLKYVAGGAGLLPPTEDLNLGLGSAYHRGKQHRSVAAASDFLKSSTAFWSQEDRDNLSVNCAIVEAMVGGAIKLWGHDWPDRQEIQFTLPLINPATGHPSTRHVFRGVIDGLWLSPLRAGEWKTTSRLDSAYIDRLELDFQIGAMLEAIGREHSVPPWTIPLTYRIAKKPQKRQRKNESVAEYAARIRADYLERPAFYFHELTLGRSEEQMVRWRQEAWRLHERILFIENGGLAVRNTQHCTHWHRCAFLDLCCGAVGTDAYRKKTTTHPELESEDA